MSSLRQLLKKRDLLTYCLLILLSLAFFWKFFLKGLVPIPADVIVGIYYPWRDHIWNNFVAGVPFKNGLLSDVVSIIYPWRIYGMELLKNGIWPLWIPHALGGTPLLANFQSGIFYPLNLLFLFFSNISAWSLYIIIQPVLASIFCFAYLRNLKLSTLPSLLGGLIFAFSGFMMVWLEYGIVGHAGLWLPLILLVIDKLLKKLSVKWIVVGSLAVGFSLLAGYPLVSFLVLLVSLAYGLYRALLSGERRQKDILSIFPFFLLGIGLAGIQLLPGLELLNFSLRQADPTTAAFNFGLNPLKNLILFLAPDFFGNPTTGNFWGGGAYNESALYISVAGFLLALIAFFFYREKKSLNFFKFLLVLSLLMAFKNPLSDFIYSLKLPILASSSAGRFLFITDFCLAILAAFGADLILAKRKTKHFFRPLIFIFILFLIFLGVILLQPGIWPDQDLLANLSVARRNLLLPTALFLTTMFLLTVVRLIPFSKLKKIGLSLLFFLIILDLFRFGFKYNPFVDREYLYPETNLTNFLEEQTGLYRFTGLIPQSMFIPYKLSSPEGYEPLMTKRYAEFANQINEEKFNQISTGSRWVIVNRYQSPLLNLLGTKYLLSFNSDPTSSWDPQYFRYPKEKYELVFQYGRSQVYENKEALPRAFIVHDFQVLGDEEILRKLMDEKFDPAETILLEEEIADLPEEKLDEDEVEISRDSYFNNQVSIKTKSSSDGLLFLSDNYYPGWRAFTDGQETKIYRANYTFRAAFLPKGDHLVKFVYSPASFRVGSLLSLISFLSLLFLGITYLIKKR